jgi:hypothetical protein
VPSIEICEDQSSFWWIKFDGQAKAQPAVAAAVTRVAPAMPNSRRGARRYFTLTVVQIVPIVQLLRSVQIVSGKSGGRERRKLWNDCRLP